MTCNSVWWVVVLLPALSMRILGQQTPSAPPYSPGDLCGEVVTALYPQWSARVSRDALARVEVRNCRLGNWGILQIAAWGEDASRPSLVLDTNRTTIVKVAMAGNVFVLETAGASSNVVHVVVFDRGRPQLALSEAIKAYAHIDISWKKVVIGLPQEKGPEKVYEFATGMN